MRFIHIIVMLFCIVYACSAEETSTDRATDAEEFPPWKIRLEELKADKLAEKIESIKATAWEDHIKELAIQSAKRDADYVQLTIEDVVELVELRYGIKVWFESHLRDEKHLIFMDTPIDDLKRPTLGIGIGFLNVTKIKGSNSVILSTFDMHYITAFKADGKPMNPHAFDIEGPIENRLGDRIHLPEYGLLIIDEEYTNDYSISSFEWTALQEQQRLN